MLVMERDEMGERGDGWMVLVCMQCIAAVELCFVVVGRLHFRFWRSGVIGLLAR